MPWRWQICIAQFLSFYKDDLPRGFQPSYCITICKKSTSDWRPSLINAVAYAPSSLLGPLPWPEFRLPSKWENRAWYQVSSLSNFSGSLLGFLAFIVICLSCVSAFLVSVVLVIFFYSSVGLAEYLTIIPRARIGFESIAHKAEGRMGHWLRGHEGERNNCFSKIQLQWWSKFLGQLTRSALIFPPFPLSPKQCCSLCTLVHFTLS